MDIVCVLLHVMMSHLSATNYLLLPFALSFLYLTRTTRMGNGEVKLDGMGSSKRGA
jgi:hypothetical protein